MRTLLVEDDPEQRETMRRWLNELGLDVTAVADGNAGLLAHLRSPFELMVVDWVLPYLDGLQLCRRVRSMPGGDRPYILMVTGRDRPEDLSRVLDAGADDYVAKPTSSVLLQTRVQIARRRVARDRRHREAQEALAQSEADFRRVIERSSVGIFAHREGRVVYVNAAAVRTLGATPEALLGRDVADLVHPAHRELAARRTARFERTQVPPPPLELEMLRDDGEAVVVRMIPASGALYRGERACFTLLEDITEKRAAECRLRMTQLAVDHAADAAFWIDEDGRITYANRAACQMSGYASGELLGMHVLELDTRFEPSDWDKIRRILLRRGRARQQTYVRCRSGSEVPVECMANVVDFDGKPFIIAFARDVSERQRMQASLQQADRLASVGSLAAGVAHEINNPLAYVIANLELLTEDLDRDRVSMVELKRTLAEATEGAHRVRRIVGDLKTFARADDDEQEVVSLHEVLDIAIDIAANEIRYRARLERHYGDIPPTWANEGRLTQVFVNLLVNAAHAIPEDGRDHVISVRTFVEEGQIGVEVADTGVGIRPEIVDRIFDPFFSTKPQGLGTGLGLSICHGIVTAMGGEIWVESDVGVGSCFHLRLPTAQPGQRVRHPQVWDDVPERSVRRLSILVIDDEPILCDGIRRALTSHDVTIVTCGLEGLRACLSCEYDLVLCDVMMPDLSGYEVYARVRDLRPGMEHRFVFMTGGAFTPKARAFLDDVPNDRILKPFTLRELRTLVAKRASHSGAHPTLEHGSELPGGCN